MCTRLTQIPLLAIVVQNAAMTVDNMTGFSAMFASQADALKTERRRTEDLLAEMLPRSVAKQLRAGGTPEAELYEVQQLQYSSIVSNEFNGHKPLTGQRHGFEGVEGKQCFDPTFS